MNLETRVGYKTISVLKDLTKEYIITNTINGVYEGDTHYITLFQELHEYLNR